MQQELFSHNCYFTIFWFGMLVNQDLCVFCVVMHQQMITSSGTIGKGDSIIHDNDTTIGDCDAITGDCDAITSAYHALSGDCDAC